MTQRGEGIHKGSVSGCLLLWVEGSAPLRTFEELRADCSGPPGSWEAGAFIHCPSLPLTFQWDVVSSVGCCDARENPQARKKRGVDI